MERQTRPGGVDIRLDRSGASPENRILLDGQDVTKLCRSVAIESTAGELTRVTLDLLPEEVVATLANPDLITKFELLKGDGHCVTCKWWERYGSVNDLGTCMRPYHYGAKFGPGDHAGHIQTEPDFGCAQWEPRV